MCGMGIDPSRGHILISESGNLVFCSRRCLLTYLNEVPESQALLAQEDASIRGGPTSFGQS